LRSGLASILLCPAGEAETMEKKSVMIVDDSRTIAWIVRETLERQGYNVRCAYSGEEAIEWLNRQTPDLIILDVMMPHMDGLEVLAKIKGSPKTAPIPVIMLTANSDHDDVLKGYRLGADYYIIKPFKQSELIHGIQLLLGREKQPTAA
jgi:DNA-binding response OmpR family regulator